MGIYNGTTMVTVLTAWVLIIKKPSFNSFFLGLCLDFGGHSVTTAFDTHFSLMYLMSASNSYKTH